MNYATNALSEHSYIDPSGLSVKVHFMSIVLFVHQTGLKSDLF